MCRDFHGKIILRTGSSMLLFLALCTLIYTNCKQEMDFVGGPVKLEFSRDTVRFDTVFTTLGSATRSFKIRNPKDAWVRIDEVEFASSDSRFRMNVDGIAGAPVRSVEIPPEDSIYVFLEVTIDPDQPPSVSPFIIRDSIRLTTDGQHQFVQLEAWGQNANYIPRSNAGGTVSLLTCDLNRIDWDDPKPYVVWGVLLIDSCHLNIPAGTAIYVHGGLGRNANGVYNDGLIYVLSRGRLTVRGTKDNPVIVQGDRLESAFDDVPGQWSGIRFGSGSEENEIEHAVIRNAISGIALDSASGLRIEQSIISNCSRFSLYARHAAVEAVNTVFNDAGQHCVNLSFGGEYRFDYCTLAGYGVVNTALQMDNFTCYDPLCGEREEYPLNVRFRNSIITGSSVDEIGMIDATDDMGLDFNYDLEHCLVRVDELLDQNQWPDFFDQCQNCLEHDAGAPLFRDVNAMDYRLDSLSQVEEQGKPIQGISEDLTGYPRDPMKPDIGAYEYRPE